MVSLICRILKKEKKKSHRNREYKNGCQREWGWQGNGEVGKRAHIFSYKMSKV